MINIEISKVMLVRESLKRYDVEKTISSPEQASDVVQKVLNLEQSPGEVFGVICMSAKNKVTAVQEVARGTLMACPAHAREVFRAAILHNAAVIILFHNHPSGDTSPSKEDIQITRKLVEAGKVMDIPVLDHIITGFDGQYTSLKEQGLMQ